MFNYIKNFSTRLKKYLAGNFRQIFLLIFMLSIFFTNSGFSEERRNPFKDWFPVIKIEPKEEEVPVVFVEPEKTFDTSVYNVEGLIWSANKPKAIINNQIYNIGNKLGEAQITKIDRDGVTLIFDEKEYVITTNKPIPMKSNEIMSNETE